MRNFYQFLQRAFLVAGIALGGAWSLGAQSDGIRVSGVTIDEERNRVAGVLVKVKGTDNATFSDKSGVFYITVPSARSVLEFSLVGYEEQELSVGDQIFFEVSMEREFVAMNEVVVTGYGSQRRLSLVGAIETVRPGNLAMGSPRVLSNTLAGNVAGVIATRTRGGEPGYDESDFWIRGISTFAGSNRPLVLVDGIERGLNDIPTVEIESFSILKDASASAMYGVRGANGVILITTKRGRIGPPRVDVHIEHSIQWPTRLPSFASGADNMELLNELAPSGHKPYTQLQIDRTRSGYDPDLYPSTDWIRAITKDYAHTTAADVTIGGGTKFLRYSMVGSWRNEQGILERDHSLPYDTNVRLNQYNMRANVDIDITKTTTVRMNVGGYLRQRRYPDHSFNTDEMFAYAFNMSSLSHPPRYSDGTIPFIGGNANPWALATQLGHKREKWTEIQSLFVVEQNLRMITPGLKAKATFSFDSHSWAAVYRNRRPQLWGVATARDFEGNLIHGISVPSDESLGHGRQSSYGKTRTYFEGNITYDRHWGRHDINALVLYNQQSYDEPAKDNGQGELQPYRKQGIAGRLSYTFDDRYVGEFNFGYNGSENFEKGHRFGFFPSFAVGWVVSEEPFMKRAKDVLSKLKLRASAGMAGNDAIDTGGSNRRFAYLTTLTTFGGAYRWGNRGNYSGIAEGAIGVSGLTWETAWKYNVGLEISLWNSLDFQVDFFREDRTNIFMKRASIPMQAGFSEAPWANYGKMTNQGIDASAEYNKHFGGDWSLNLRGTFTFARNKVVEIDEAAAVKGTHRSQTGRPLNTLWGLLADGLFTADDFDSEGKLIPGIPPHEVGSSTIRPGDIRYVDRNGDGRVDELDEGYIGGTTDPKIVYGFGGQLKWRSIDVGFFFQGAADSWRIIGGGDWFLPGSGGSLMGNPYSNYQDRWTEANPSQKVFWPRLSDAPNKHNQRSSTWWKKDMSFLRLKSVELGWSLPTRWIERVGLKGLRVYVSGNDIFLISKFKMWDPEVKTDNGSRYPSMASVLFGINLSF